jgi:hypothetical protein
MIRRRERVDGWGALAARDDEEGESRHEAHQGHGAFTLTDVENPGDDNLGLTK